ncbi:hypothetical protein M9Y10_010959 [Tritrichomonas musculus]|uniref:Uncharacterized protein n=1 Tax=Tritrichomonas musculus TaxID=1915356 RepID=A0ABR2IMA0_9EUKA
MKREWIRLSPQHYKPNKEMNFSFDVNEDIKLKIGALRGISYSINEKLKEIASFLTPDLDSYDLNQLNDPNADIVAITAILYKSNKIAQLIKSCIDKNDTFILHKPFKIETISLIVKSSFYFSKNPIDLNIAILNCLLAAIRISINQFIPLINENKESLMKLFTSEEIDELTGKTINKQIGKDSKDISNDMINNKKVDFLSKIENAVFVLLNPASVLFASVIATSITKQFNIAKIKKFDFGTKSIREEIIKIADENTINKNCECLLLTEAKNSLHHLNLICDAFIMNDIMKIVANKLHYFSALSFLRLLMENLEDTQNKLLIEEFIGQNDEMEKELIQNNISIFYIPVIFAFLPEKVIIYALYASISSKQMNWYAEFFKMLESIKNKVNEKLYEDIVGMSKFELKNQENIKDSSENDKFVDYMRNEIKKEQKIAISKATKLIDMSIKKARDNIIKRMNIDVLSDQINEYYDFLSLVPQNKYDNKFHKYLYSSITKLTEVMNTYKITPRCEKCEKDEKGTIILDKLEEDINNFKRRASNELFVVSELFNISKKSLRDFNSKLSKKIDLKSIFNFSACSMLARSLNIVEMAPITDLLENYKNIFNEQDGENPDIKEIMGLHAANIYILSDKDKKRKRFITKNEDNENNKEDENNKDDENIEDDTYYSDDYIEEDYSFPIRLLQSESKDEKIISSDDSPKLSPFSNFNYHKDQLVGTEIESIRENLNLKQGNWTCEVWTAFLYCFNKRMKNIGIRFDPENDYKDAKYPVTIGEAILIVEQFFPLNRIHDFWRNEEKIKLFVGKYANHSREILRAIVRGFDDADRIVTPIHMFHETYQERTPEKLNLIFDY